MSGEPELRHLARRVRDLGRLTLRRGPEAGLEEREDIAEALARLARPERREPRTPTAWRAPTEAWQAGPSPADQAERRLRALVQHQEREIAALHAALTQARQSRRRRRRALDAQLPLPLGDRAP